MMSNATFDSARRWAPPLVFAGLACAVVVAFAMMPLRIWLDQRESLSQLRDERIELEQEVEELDAQHRLLETDGEVERQARENFDLVYPGEESYRILPSGD